MRYLAKRVERICDELYRLRIVQRIPLTDLICKKGTYIRPEAADAATPPWTSFDSRTMHWYGPDEHCWFRTEFTVPKALNGKAMWRTPAPSTTNSISLWKFRSLTRRLKRCIMN